jgi:glycosyltransferase involved in cell wall biosynthesis
MKLNLNESNTTEIKPVEKEPVQIVFIITGLSTGGAEMMLYKFLSRIDRNRFCPTVITLIDGGVFVDRVKAFDISIYSLGMQPGKPSISALQKLTKLLNEIKPDLIQGWMYHSNLAAQLANSLAQRKVPVLWSIHHSIESLWAEKITLAATIKLTALLSNKTEKVVFSSEKGKTQHLALGYCSKNAITIGDNFDLSKYKPASQSASQSQPNLRQSLNLAETSILIGSIARYHPMKDHANFLNAAAKIAPKHPEVHFILIGPGVDNQNLVLSEQIQKLGIGDQVHLLGERQDIPILMASLDIFTSSSAYGESFPNVLGEAMSCEIPCVATNVGDSDLIVGDTGIIVPTKDSEALAQAWQKLILLGRKGRQNLGEKARERIKQSFDLDAPNSFVKKYESIYETLLSSKRN